MTMANMDALQSRELPEFASLHHPLWQEAVAGSTLIQCPAGKDLLARRGAPKCFLILLQGGLKVYNSGENGREISLYRIYPGQLCVPTLMPLLGSANNTQMMAEQDSRILAVPAGYLPGLLDGSDGFRRHVISAMSGCIDDVMQLIMQVNFKPLQVRLTQFLQRRACHDTGLLCITHQAVADEMGSTREVVSRVLKTFEKAGHVKLGRGKIEVRFPRQADAFRDSQ